MCGIAGSITQNPLNDNIKHQINLIQRHRGPDGNGVYSKDLSNGMFLTFLHQRLSIIDLSHGHQPMIDENAGIVVVFNGEIYNHLTLRRKLEKRGCKFTTDHSDTEVLIHLYTQYKNNMCQMLNGMYSFIIYDIYSDVLFGARDQSGIKPLYYFHSGNELYFASELKTLMLFGLDKNIDFQSIANYLSFQFVPSPRTIFSNIRKLPAAHYIEYDIGKNILDVKRYWSIDFSPLSLSVNEWEEKILYQLTKSVELWSASDVEIGASLSGGLDSSAIVAIYANLSKNKIKTFSLGFDGSSSYLDERELARYVSKKYNTDHYEAVLTEGELIDEIDLMVYHLDEPYAGGLPSWFIYKMMKGRVKVALTGTGGDELFGNYNKSLIYSSNILRRVKRFVSASMQDLLGALRLIINHPKGFYYHRYFKGYEISKLLQYNKFEYPENIIDGYINDSCQIDFRNVVPYVDFNMQLPDEFLHMTDRFSMAHSIEARVPFLDPNMIRTIMSIPPEIRMSFSDPKYMLRNAIDNLLPNELLMAPKKGFVLPEAQWLRTILRNEVVDLLNADFLEKQGIFDKSTYKKIVEPHLSGKCNNAWQVWTLLMFQKWYVRYYLNI